MGIGRKTSLAKNGLLKQLTKALLERAMDAEMTDHLGYEKHDPAGYNSGNSRNGKSRKKLKGDFGEMEVETPRDRNGTFEPKIVAKHQTRFTGFDEKILSMYARGMTTREIQAHLQEIYGVEVSPTLVSNVTEAVQDEVRAWQNRPLEPIYPIVYMDALYVRMRDNGHVQNRAVYVAIGVNLDGHKEVLGLWTSANEGAKFWLQVHDRNEEPRRAGRLYRLRRRVERLSGSYRSGVSERPGAVVHRPPGAAQSELRVLETAPSRGGGLEADLRSGDGGRSGAPAGRIRGEMGRDAPDHQPGVAAQLGADYAVLRVSGRDSED